MNHLRKFESFNRIETEVVEKTSENFLFLKAQFPDIPISLEQYLERDHIFVCESRIDGRLIGSCMSVIRTTRADIKDIAIPVEYTLPRIHINYIRTLEEFRSKGVGKDLVGKSLSYGESKDVGIVTANVKIDNIASQRLFMSCGFDRSDTLTKSGSYTFYKIT